MIISLRPSHHRLVHHAHQRIHIRLSNLLHPRLPAKHLQRRLQRLSHSLEHRNPDIGLVVLVLVRDRRFRQPTQVRSPSRERHDVVAGIELRLPHLDFEVFDSGEVLLADALEQGVGLLASRGSQIQPGFSAGEDDGRAQVGDEAQREGGVRVVRRQRLVAKLTRGEEGRRLVRQQRQVPKALEVLLVDVGAQLRGQLEELGELDVLVCLLEFGDQRRLSDGVFGDVDVSGADELFELFDETSPVVGDATGLAVVVGDGIVAGEGAWLVVREGHACG